MIDAAFGTPLPAPPLRAAGSSRIEHAWAVLATVLDPEVPVVSVVDLGIVREVSDDGDALTVVVTPTYSGCPATEVIEASIVAALDDAGLGPTRIRMQRAPAWTTDWISEDGRRKLAEHGIAPPRRGAGGPVTLNLVPPASVVACPRCGSRRTTELSRFSSTACKALRRCADCLEPFEHVKEI